MVEEFESVGSVRTVKLSQGHIMPHW